MPELDSRKEFISKAVQAHFGLSSFSADNGTSSEAALNNFLDSINHPLLVARSNRGADVQLANELGSGSCDDALFFVKSSQAPVTEQNCRSVIQVHSLSGNPVESFHATLHNLYSPSLALSDPGLQQFLADLEKRIGKSLTQREDGGSILTLSDEARYWRGQANSGGSKGETAQQFYEALQPVEDSYTPASISALNLEDLIELLENTHDCLDELWKAEVSSQYKQSRMENMMNCVARSAVSCIENYFADKPLWNSSAETSAKMVQEMSVASRACKTWMNACEQLTTRFWPRYAPHPWQGGLFIPRFLENYSKRLEQICDVHHTYQSLLAQLSSGERSELEALQPMEKAFGNFNATQYSPHTEAQWATALAQFDRLIEPFERQAAVRLKSQLGSATAGNRSNPTQLLREFQRHEALLKRPTIGQALSAEKETLLGQLQVQLKQIKDKLNSAGSEQRKASMELPEVVSSINAVQLCESKVLSSRSLAKTLLSSLSAYEKFDNDCKSILDETKMRKQRLFDEWSQDVMQLLDEPKNPIALESSGRLLDLNSADGRLRVNYSERLVVLLREVRLLNSFGFPIPSKIRKAADTAQRFYRHSVILKQVANFYNSIDKQMLPSQQALLLDLALKFEQLIKNPSGKKGGDNKITWDNPAQLEAYISKLQQTAEKLTTENRKLRKHHQTIEEKVLKLMQTDLLRHSQRWKDTLGEIRQIMHGLQAQGFSADNMRPWQVHWDRQLYKALEHQYQMALESLNENLPEIRVDLVFKNQLAQFNPPFEEIQMRYYREMRKLIAIPTVFRGVGDEGAALFSRIIDTNSAGLITCYEKAQLLMQRLRSARDRFAPWIAIGSWDMDQYVDENLVSLADFENAFRSLKAKGREVEKLPLEIKIDCITVSCVPIKASVDSLIQRVFDALTAGLRRRAMADVGQIDSFLNKAMQLLEQRPQTVEEVGEANAQHGELLRQKPEIYPLFSQADEKNTLLRQVAGHGLEQISELRSRWDKFDLSMESHQLMIKEQVQQLKNNVKNEAKIYQQDLEKFSARWQHLKPKDELLTSGDADACIKAAQMIKEKLAEFEEMHKKKEKLVADCTHFELDVYEFPLADELWNDMQTYNEMLGVSEEFYSGLQKLSKEDWISFRSRTYEFEEFLVGWFERLKAQEHKSMITVILQKEIDRFRDLLPLLKFTRGESFSQDHWMEFFRVVGVERGVTLERLRFEHILAAADGIVANAQYIKELNQRAQGEVTVREAIRELELWGVSAVFAMTDYQDTKNVKLVIIKDFKELLSQVGDNKSLLQSLKSSPYYKAFEDKVVVWEQRMANLDEFLYNLNQIQRKWVYLEPIFGRGALPHEQGRFRRVDNDFRSILSDIGRDNRVLTFVGRPGMQQLLQQILDQLHRCQKALNEYLEEKRSNFPRFYFIGDDDLLEILGQSTNPQVIQAHLKKLFAGIHAVQFDKECHVIEAMRSLDGEVVPLRNQVRIVPEVEIWLSELSKEMKSTLQQLLFNCVKELRGKAALNPNKYPSQVLCTAEMILFTDSCEQAIAKGGLQQLLNDLSGKLDSYTSVELGHDQEAIVLDLKLKALVLDTIHHIDVVEHLMRGQVRSAEAWLWQKQLRFVMSSRGECGARMVDAEFAYTYEYQGNAPKLVHTPLTDKCYLTLTQAMQMGLGGNPYGPAGTGKTESVKALGQLLGRQVLVFNCDEGLDVKSMGRIFVGLAKCGAYGCLDEFNRLETAVLSAVSQQIQVIQDAIRSKATHAELMGRRVDIDCNAGIFITLNPAGKGYGGRQKLPDNLKQLFRPVAMSKPDNELIAENILFSEGFKTAKQLGRKLVAVFSLCTELLTPQQFYDWGLRALKTVLKGCGSFLKTEKKSAAAAGAKVDANTEVTLVVRALRGNTLSKLTFADSIRFDQLVKDIFPGVQLSSLQFADLEKELREVYAERRLLVLDGQIKKSLELYEQLRQRMGVVVVGPSGAGKSVLWRCLQAAMERLQQRVVVHVMNPKAMPRQQLLGHIDLDTREWSDGVLTESARRVVAEDVSVRSWIVCDGDIDPEWVESLNSVLDDNRLLTMPSGERIQFGPNVNFLFETHDLSCASPATISRLGMVLVSDEDTSAQAIVHSWLHQTSAVSATAAATKNDTTGSTSNDEQDDEAAKDRERLQSLLDDYFHKALEFIVKLSPGDVLLETSYVGTVLNGLSHLRHTANSRAAFTLGLIRGFGGNLKRNAYEKFAQYVFDLVGEAVPDSNDPLNACIDSRSGRLTVYRVQASDDYELQYIHNGGGTDSSEMELTKQEPITLDKLSISSTQLPVVLTPEICRFIDGFSTLLAENNAQSFLLCGGDGVGKGLLLTHCFARLRSVNVASMHCSAQTTPLHLIQKLNQICFTATTYTGKVLRPKGCARVILYLKDINLPKPDKWGTSQLVAFLQQLLTYHGYYDHSLEWIGVENVQVVASMNPLNSMGRHKLSSRFTSVMRVCSMELPSREGLESIYRAYLKPILHRQLSGHPIWSQDSKIATLAANMVQMFESLRKEFSVDRYSHYQITPRDLTAWCLAFLRYDLAPQNKGAEHVLEIWAHEAYRLFRDRLVDEKALGSPKSNDADAGERRRSDVELFDVTLTDLVSREWSCRDMHERLGSSGVVQSDGKDHPAKGFWTSWGAKAAGGGPMPQNGKLLGRLGRGEIKTVVEKGLLQYTREQRDLDDVLVLPELCEYISRFDRVLTMPSGSLLLVGRPGIGRRTAVSIVAHMHQYQFFTPKISRNYTMKHFRQDLKLVMQTAGIDGEQVLFLLEDHQLIAPDTLEMLNSVLSGGEVPGLYKSEELEPLIGPLEDQRADANFRGSLIEFFSSRVKRNLHICLVMDPTNEQFTVRCESNPAFFKQCTVNWMNGWSKETMTKVPHLFLTRAERVEGAALQRTAGKKEGRQELDGGTEEMCQLFRSIHESAVAELCCTRYYIQFLKTYKNVFGSKKDTIEQHKNRLANGVGKLNEAKRQVDELKGDASKKSERVQKKQAEAEAALEEIQQTLQASSEQKSEMQKMQAVVQQENQQLAIRQKSIEAELKDIQPVLDEARRAIGGIEQKALSEIRSLRAPPDTIRDILEAVMLLNGQKDTSWSAMKNFLAQRGMVETIANFDPRNINAESRANVEALLKKKADSFEEKNAKRASVAAAPLAKWAKASVKYSYVVEKVQPLELEQTRLKKNLEQAEQRMAVLEQDLSKVDAKVNGLKKRYQQTTGEVAQLQVALKKAQDTIAAAERLVGALEGEYQRWNVQLKDLERELTEMPRRCLVAAAFLTYLPSLSEDLRTLHLRNWLQRCRIEAQTFDIRRFLSQESEQLLWKGQGLPSDDLTVENALVIRMGTAVPFLIDPSSRATDWLRVHWAEQNLEVIGQQDDNFSTQLELALRFGKTLIIRDVDGVEPVLFPILRRDLTSQGPKHVVQVGDKTVDFNLQFRLVLTTRNPAPDLTPDARAIVSVINFTTTKAGLTGQLLATTIQHEKPELEQRKSDLLQKEESLKIKLAQLEASLLQELASAQGNILENTELLNSLNETKASSLTISEALEESLKLQLHLDEERSIFAPVAEFGANLFFVIGDLYKLNSMYRYNLSAFLRLFERALKLAEPNTRAEQRIADLKLNLLKLVYDYVTRSLFKADRLPFALYLVHGVLPDYFQPNEWQLFCGMAGSSSGDERAHSDSSGSAPSWVPNDRRAAVGELVSVLPALNSVATLNDSNGWSSFLRDPHPEQNFPQRKCSLFQQVLLTQALRPDRLISSMTQFAKKSLNMRELAPETTNLRYLVEEEADSLDPILIMISPGADPSQELQELANNTVGLDNYHQVAMGQGQSETALQLLDSCSRDGQWLCLKNLHLVTAWLPVLEKQVNSLKPSPKFRLFLTAESHPKFPVVLLQRSLKISYESPPGVKKNLLRSLDTWGSQFFGNGSELRSASLFALAWFHAIVQERRTYIPQGWTKFYEFSLADLRTGADILSRLFQRSRDQVDWEFVHGLFEFAIYGGRVDNPFDVRVMISYLRDIFNRQLGPNSRLGPMAMPSSKQLRDYVGVVQQLSDIDVPNYFGLPENIESSWQVSTGSVVLQQLRLLMKMDTEGRRFDRAVWNAELSPYLSLWRSLNKGNPLINAKMQPPAEKEGESPVTSFIRLENYNGVRLLQYIHQNFGALHKVIKGLQLMNDEIYALGEALMAQETPQSWLKMWNGPEDPMQFLRSLTNKVTAVQKWVERAENGSLLRETLHLGELFHPDTFLNAFRQLSARQLGTSMDNLKFVASWSSAGIAASKSVVRIDGLVLEGCQFDGARLTESRVDSARVSAVPSCSVAWIEQNSSEPYSDNDSILLPVYYTQERDSLVCRMKLPCQSGSQNKWLQAGAALLLQS